MSIAVSTARVDITPSSTNPYMAGYGGAAPRESTGTNSPLYARCVIIWDDGNPNALITADVLGFPRSLHQSIRQQLLPLAAWASSDFVLTATHTHNGPVLLESPDPQIMYGLTDLTGVSAYSSWLAGQIVALVQAALAAPRTSCTLDYKVATQNWSSNREGLIYNETAVPILVARRGDGTPAAVLFSYGCHPVTAGPKEQWDGDFPARACTYIESNVANCFAQFLPGPAGDQDPAGVRDWSLRNQLGDGLGNAVASASRSAGRAIGGSIASSYREASLPLDITNTPANMAAVKAAFQARLREPGLLSWYAAHARAMIARIDAGQIATTVPVPVQVWKFPGSPLLRFCFVGGELVSGYAVYFRNRYGNANGLMLGGYANETSCYIPSNELLPPIRSSSSYAGGWDTDFPGIAGGSMTIYPYIGHFRAGGNGVESALITAINNALA